MNKPSANKHYSLIGVMMTVAVTVALVWAGLQWKNRYNWPRPLTDKEKQANRTKTIENLQRIYAAQERYKLTDWDGDGRYVYSRYLANLWTTPNQESDPVQIDLIPKQLAFAMGPQRAADGYFYSDLKEREVDSRGTIRKNDYTKEWALAAVEADDNPEGGIVFLIDNSGTIMMKHVIVRPVTWPLDPLANGWKIVKNTEQLSGD